MGRVVPRILAIDDDTSSAIKTKLAIERLAKVTTLHPQDVELADLLKADLVLVDYDLTYWPERDRISSVSLSPTDGLALTSVLQRHVYARTEVSPTAFALYTGKLDKLAEPLPRQHREHALAHINNLEWVFQKGKTSGAISVVDQIVELASSVRQLPRVWPKRETEQMALLAKLLGVPVKLQLREQLLADVAGCLPPIRELSQWTHGQAVLRWMLHRILPYPCFLWDSFRLAARFRIDHDELQNALAADKPLRRKLRGCEYNGILSRFLGPRWWRASIEQYLWEGTRNKSSEFSSVAALIRKHAKSQLASCEPADFPVVCVDQNYQPLGRFSSMKDAVRIRPDDWPAYADQAWVTIELAKEELKLRALVVQEDREKLS